MSELFMEHPPFVAGEIIRFAVHLTNLSDYQKALAQKNAALKRQMDPSAFDFLLVSLGSKIIMKRFEFVSALSERLVKYYETISQGEAISVTYQ